jgi:hypothetical protein
MQTYSSWRLTGNAEEWEDESTNYDALTKCNCKYEENFPAAELNTLRKVLKAVPQLRRLVAGFPQRWPRLESRSGHVGFVVDNHAASSIIWGLFHSPNQFHPIQEKGDIEVCCNNIDIKLPQTLNRLTRVLPRLRDMWRWSDVLCIQRCVVMAKGRKNVQNTSVCTG